MTAPITKNDIKLLEQPKCPNMKLTRDTNITHGIASAYSEIKLPCCTAISKEEVERAEQLRIEVFDGPIIDLHRSFQITAAGYMHSHRKARDGCVYFGSKTKDQRSGNWINDVIIPQGELGMGQRHFMIKYVIESQNYFIKDMGEGTGTFVKIIQPLELKQGYIISFGESHMIISWNPQSEAITVKFLDGGKSDQIL